MVPLPHMHPINMKCYFGGRDRFICVTLVVLEPTVDYAGLELIEVHLPLPPKHGDKGKYCTEGG